MVKKITVGALFFSLFFLLIGGFLVFENYNQTEVFAQEKVVYQLPYPGLLPDHPLYFVKAIRDKMVEFLTRDLLKKTNLYLLYSDKKAAIALMLQKKGKYKMSLDVLLKAEETFFKIIPLLDLSKKQGVAPSADLVEKIKTSNQKHQEIIENFLKTAPVSQKKTIDRLINLNLEIKEKLKKL